MQGGESEFIHSVHALVKKTLLSIKKKALFLGCYHPQTKPKGVLGPVISGGGVFCVERQAKPAAV